MSKKEQIKCRLSGNPISNDSRPNIVLLNEEVFYKI